MEGRTTASRPCILRAVGLLPGRRRAPGGRTDRVPGMPHVRNGVRGPPSAPQEPCLNVRAAAGPARTRGPPSGRPAFTPRTLLDRKADLFAFRARLHGAGGRSGPMQSGTGAAAASAKAGRTAQTSGRCRGAGSRNSAFPAHHAGGPRGRARGGRLRACASGRIVSQPRGLVPGKATATATAADADQTASRWGACDPQRHRLACTMAASRRQARRVVCAHGPRQAPSHGPCHNALQR